MKTPASQGQGLGLCPLVCLLRTWPSSQGPSIILPQPHRQLVLNLLPCSALQVFFLLMFFMLGYEFTEGKMHRS